MPLTRSSSPLLSESAYLSSRSPDSFRQEPGERGRIIRISLDLSTKRSSPSLFRLQKKTDINKDTRLYTFSLPEGANGKPKLGLPVGVSSTCMSYLVVFC